MGENWVSSNAGISDNSLHSLHLDMEDYLYVEGWYLHRSSQDISGNAAGDLNLYVIINILDVIEMISFLLENSVYN